MKTFNTSSMKNLYVFIIFTIVLSSCGNESKTKTEEIAQANLVQEDFQSFGEKISAENSLSAAQMKQKFESLQPGDTINAKFRTTVNSVCKMKGCWMTLQLPDNDEDPMVKFKDYGFFVPKDIEGKEVIVQGIAFIEETSVEDQRHFAEDAGKSKEEIEAISKPKHSMSFLAEGVLLKE